MATRKKATATKPATTAKKPTIRGGSARTTARDADTGLPPAGTLDDRAVDAAVLGWKTKQVKSKSDDVNYRTKTDHRRRRRNGWWSRRPAALQGGQSARR